MAWQLKKTIVLVGMMGSGKTAVGTALAALLGVPFVDSDREIEAAANLTIAEIFERFGEPMFRDKEAQVLVRLLAGPPVVLSTGGGAFLRAENRDEIARLGVSVWLDAPLEVLWGRVKGKNTRPLLRNDDPKGTLQRIYDDRVPVYGLADLTVSTLPVLPLAGMAARVAAAVARDRPDVLMGEQQNA